LAITPCGSGRDDLYEHRSLGLVTSGRNHRSTRAAVFEPLPTCHLKRGPRICSIGRCAAADIHRNEHAGTVHRHWSFRDASPDPGAGDWFGNGSRRGQRRRGGLALTRAAVSPPPPARSASPRHGSSDAPSAFGSHLRSGRGPLDILAVLRQRGRRGVAPLPNQDPVVRLWLGADC
jgi:hypothetical protein